MDNPGKPPLFVVEDRREFLRINEQYKQPKILVGTREVFNPYILARKKGMNWLNFIYIHANSISDVDKDIIFSSWEILKIRTLLPQPSLKAVTSKTMSRRDFLRAPRTILEYSTIPFIRSNIKRLRKEAFYEFSQICPFNAIDVDSQEILSNKCTECGLCASLAPEDIIGYHLLPPEGIKNSIKILAGNKKTKIIYSDIEAVEEVFSLGISAKNLVLPIICPEGISWKIILFHILSGIPAIVYWRNKKDKCPISNYLEKLLSDLKTLGLSEYLLICKDTSCVMNALKRENQLPPKNLSMLLDRENYLETLYSNIEKQFNTDTWLPLNVFGTHRIILDENKCTLCGACVNECPYNALSLLMDAKMFTLYVDTLNCRGCYNCIYTCPEKAILKVDRGISIPKDTLLAKDKAAKCIKCGKIIGSEKSLTSIENRLRLRGISEKLILYATRMCSECKAMDFTGSE